jgi:hypothetical protein
MRNDNKDINDMNIDDNNKAYTTFCVLNYLFLYLKNANYAAFTIRKMNKRAK